MFPATADTLLVTPAQLNTYQRGELAALEDVAEGGKGERTLKAVQDNLAAYLGFTPFVHPATLFFEADTRLRARTSAGTYYYAAAGGPVVEVPTGLLIGTGANAGRLLFTASADYTFYRGWRRADHDLGDLQAIEYPEGSGETPLADLTVLPGVVPGDVFTALCEAALYVARRATEAGKALQTVDLGAQVKTTEAVYALNDVNTLIGRKSELDAIWEQYAWAYRVARL